MCFTGVTGSRGGEAGFWEEEATRRGIVLTAVEGLPRPRLITARGCDPVLLFPAGWAGPVREYICAWACAEVYRRAFGPAEVARRIVRAVRQTREAAVFAGD